MKHPKSLAALLLCAGLVLNGCSCGKSAVQTDITLGEEAEGREIVVIENESEITFTGVEMKLLSEKSFSSSFLKDNEKFENGKTASLYVPESAKTEEDQKSSDKEPISLRFFNTGTVWEFDDFEYFDVKDKAVLKKDNDDLVLTYESRKDKKEVTIKGLPDPVSVLNDEQKADESSNDSQKNENSSNGEAIPAENGSLDEPGSTEPGAASENGEQNSDGSNSSKGDSGNDSNKDSEKDDPYSEEENSEDSFIEDAVFDPPVTRDPRD